MVFFLVKFFNWLVCVLNFVLIVVVGLINIVKEFFYLSLVLLLFLELNLSKLNIFVFVYCVVRLVSKL